MEKWLAIGVLASCAFLAGCDADRITKLEKENADLKAQVEKQNAALDYSLQEKCSKDARTWFNENWSGDKDTILLNFTNHFNAKENRCFILVEYHYKSNFAGPGGNSWTNLMSLTDVNQNAKLAYFAENHVTNWKPEYSLRNEVISCNVLDKECKTGDEFNNLISHYMTD